MEQTILDQQEFQEKSFNYAGFWARVGAFILDLIILSVAKLVITYIITGQATEDNNSPLGWALLAGDWLYYALLESSAVQATLGKMAVGIVVTDEQGERISFLRATGRYFGKFVSAIILGIGFIMAGFTQRKQALHDIMASTLVIFK